MQNSSKELSLSISVGAKGKQKSTFNIYRLNSLAYDGIGGACEFTLLARRKICQVSIPSWGILRV